MYTLICYKNCSTCKDVEKSLKNLELAYNYREITEKVPTSQELWTWYHASGVSSLKKIMNTSGAKYRELNLKDKLKGLSELQQLELISQDGMLIKRPILLGPDKQVYIGPMVKEYLAQMALDKEQE